MRMGNAFAGRRILVVEDEYLLAQCLADLLQSEGAEVVGPASCVADANALLEGNCLPDVAVLDINLGSEDVYPLADRLADHHVPRLFTSGYERDLVPPRHAGCPHCAKPFGVEQVRTRLLALLDDTADA